MNLASSSLRHRFFFAIGGILLFALIALGAITRYQVTPALLAEEDRFAASELDRIERALSNELQHLEILVEDWAWWDDTYAFIKGHNPGFVGSNLYLETLSNLGLRLMVFFSEAGEPYWIAGIDPDSNTFTSCPGLINECQWAAQRVAILTSKLAEPFEETQGWMLAAPEQAMLSISPIYMSQASAPARGWLAMIRPLSPARLDQLRDSTGLALDITPVTSNDALDADNLQRLSDEQMLATRDIDAAPTQHALRIEADLPRQRHQASLSSFRFALYWTGAVLLMVLIVVLLLLERMVLAPLRQFSRFTQQASHAESVPTTPATLLRRCDEIGMLAREFQQLLFQQQLRASSLLKQSQHDYLTGLANRRYFDERLAAALNVPLAQRGHVAVLMLDIDYFKRYNDHYGHQAGDQCLVALAHCMNQCMVTEDFLVARTGGEEFSVLLPGLDLAAAHQRAEALRESVASLALPHATSLNADIITVSIGVAAVSPGQPLDPATLMRRADRALYRAKETGRNRSCQYTTAPA